MILSRNCNCNISLNKHMVPFLVLQSRYILMFVSIVAINNQVYLFIFIWAKNLNITFEF